MKSTLKSGKGKKKGIGHGLLKDAENEWNTSIVATQKGNTAHLPTKHSVFKSRCKSYLRGFSETLHSAELTVTYCNDNNAVVFPGSDVELGREHIIKSARQE